MTAGVSDSRPAYVGYIRRSGLFIAIAFASNIFEVGFYGLTARLPGEGYETFNALFNLFFIFIVPLTSVQLMVSREVAGFLARGEGGRAHSFLGLSFKATMLVTAAAAAAGMVLSPFIASFLRIGNPAPVMLLMAVIFCYVPYPLFYGGVQGMKRAGSMGLLQFTWGATRFTAAVVVILGFSGGVTPLMAAVSLAVALCSVVAWILARPLMTVSPTPVARGEVLKAYRLVLPIMIAMFCVIALKNMDIIFAKRFFDSDAAKAYTCAARVGAAFFTLSNIIMVMFPHVSEVRSQNGNPLVFLLKSFEVILGMSAVGIVFCWTLPGVVMRLITFGAVIPGAEPLIRLIGPAVLPLALSYIIANYLLAKGSVRFLPVIIGGLLLQIILIHLLHGSPMRLLTAIGIANIATFLAMLAEVSLEHRRYLTGLVTGT